MRSGQGRELGMAGRRATLVAILSLVLVACSAEAQPSQAERASPDPSVGAPSPAAVTPSPTAAPAVPTLTPDPTATPTPAPTAAPKPPKPTGVKFSVHEEALGSGGLRLTAKVTWRSPRNAGVTIRVYNVTECLSRPTPYMPENAVGPCLVEDTPLPPSALKLAAKAPASAGTVSWTWIDDSDCGWDAAREIVVLAAYSTAGHSVFAIAAPGLWSTKEALC
jgi:hypothetical protein